MSSAALTERNGFTVGRILMRQPDGGEYRVAVCNEYLALQRNGELLAAFPDLITLFDFDSGIPLSSAEVRAGRRVAVFGVPRQQLKLGSTMKDAQLLRPIERLLNLRLTGQPPRAGLWPQTYAHAPYAYAQPPYNVYTGSAEARVQAPGSDDTDV